MEPEDEGFKAPDYFKQPLIAKYLDRAQHLVDEMVAETSDEEQTIEVYQLRGVLMAVIGGILFDGQLEEMDVVMRMTFPGFYGSQTTDVINYLTRLPLSTIN